MKFLYNLFICRYDVNAIYLPTFFFFFFHEKKDGVKLLIKDHAHALTIFLTPHIYPLNNSVGNTLRLRLVYDLARLH